MIFIKFIICLIIVFICVYLGLEKAKSYEERVLELQKIKSGLTFFRSKIEFTYEPIREILKEISSSIYLNDENIFLKAKDYMKQYDVSFAWNKAIEENKKITKEDKEVLKLFGKLLGKTDKKGQINEIELSSDFIDNQIQKAETEKNKNSKLYKSLGTLIGIGITIILW